MRMSGLVQGGGKCTYAKLRSQDGQRLQNLLLRRLRYTGGYKISTNSPYSLMKDALAIHPPRQPRIPLHIVVRLQQPRLVLAANDPIQPLVTGPRLLIGGRQEEALGLGRGGEDDGGRLFLDLRLVGGGCGCRGGGGGLAGGGGAWGACACREGNGGWWWLLSRGCGRRRRGGGDKGGGDGGWRGKEGADVEGLEEVPGTRGEQVEGG